MTYITPDRFCEDYTEYKTNECIITIHNNYFNKFFPDKFELKKIINLITENIDCEITYTTSETIDIYKIKTDPDLLKLFYEYQMHTIDSIYYMIEDLSLFTDKHLEHSLSKITEIDLSKIKNIKLKLLYCYNYNLKNKIKTSLAEKGGIFLRLFVQIKSDIGLTNDISYLTHMIYIAKQYKYLLEGLGLNIHDYEEWINIGFIKIEKIILESNNSSFIANVSKEEYRLLQMFRNKKDITTAHVTFKLDGENKKLNKYEIVESTSERKLNEWLKKDGEITTFRNNGMVQGISRIIKGSFNKL